MSGLFPEVSGDAQDGAGSGLFPESAGSAPAAPAAAPRKMGSLPAEELNKHKLATGHDARARFRRLMDLPGRYIFGTPADVVDVTWVFLHERIDVTIEGGGLPRTVLNFIKKDASEIGRDGCDISVRHKGAIPNATVQRFIRETSRRLQKARFATLRKIAFMDPERKLLAWREERHVEEDDAVGSNSDPYRESLAQSYASDFAWFQFFADHEQRRNFNHHLIGEEFLVVEHEDLECHYATPAVNDGTVSFFNYAGAHGDGNVDAEDERRRRNDSDKEHKEPRPTYMLTDLDDLDIVMGGTRKLDHLLEGIGKWEEKPDFVLVRQTCVPTIIGDDVEASVRKFEEGTGITAVMWDNIERPEEDRFNVVMARLAREGVFTRERNWRGGVNFVGFPQGEFFNDMERFVGGLGGRLNVAMVPDVDLPRLRGFPDAELMVLFDSDLFQDTYDELLPHFDMMKSVRPSAPYGFEGTRKWMLAIAKALGREDRFDACWNAYESVWRPDWERIRSQTEPYQLGFVVDHRRMEFLMRPASLTGVPLIGMIAEAGFDIEMLYFEGDGHEGRADVDKLSEQYGANISYKRFTSVGGLRDLLEASRSHAFYSDLYFDTRLTRLGKAQFSSADFHMGLGGAVRTARKLLHTCRLPFYRVHHRHLGAAF